MFHKQSEEPVWNWLEDLRLGNQCAAQAAVAPVRLLSLPGNVFKEKRTPETGNNLKRWRSRSQPNHLGAGDSEEGKQLAGVMAGTHVYFQGQGHQHLEGSDVTD